MSGCIGEWNKFSRRATSGSGYGRGGGGSAGERRLRRARALAGGRTLAVLRREAPAKKLAPRYALQAPGAAL